MITKVFKLYLNRRLTIKSLLIFSLFIWLPTLTQAQVSNCNTEISPELFEAYFRDKMKNDYSLSRGSNSTFTVPVRYTILRRTDGTKNFFPKDAADVQELIDKLNSDYTGSGITFVHCGSPIFIDSDYYYENASSLGGYFEWEEGTLLELSYASSDANAYSPAPNVATSSATLPCTPNDPLGCPINSMDYDNLLFLNGAAYSPTVAHEFGHHLGLLHTYGSGINFDIAVQDDPTNMNGQQDHPYAGTTAARELIIRDGDDVTNKIFKEPNCEMAGDFCCDTPVTGLNANVYTSSTGFWPEWGFQFDGNCCAPPEQPICCTGIPGGVFEEKVNNVCTLSGPYRDYNGDAFEDQPNLQSIPLNFMSYTSCTPTTFSQDQFDRMHHFFNIRRSMQYENALCGNFNDRVTFWDTETIMNEVSIQTRHNSNITEKYANTFTDTDGDFSSILYDTELTAEVRKLGEEGLDNYTLNDWQKGLSIMDVIAIGRSIVGLDLFENGYKYLSADVDRDHAITVFDMVEVQKMILFYSSSFENYNDPWQFIPEYIPTNFSTDFHSNPFSMNIDGVMTNGVALYIESDWEYNIANGNNDQNGFHGYKLGDVDMSSSGLQSDCYELNYSVGSNQLLQPGVPVQIGLSVQGDKTIEGLQMGLQFNSNVDVDDVSSILQGFDEYTNAKVINSGSGDEVRVVWHDVYGQGTLASDAHLTVTISVNQATYLSDLFEMKEESNFLISDFTNCNTVATIETSVLEDKSEERDVNQNNKLIEAINIFPNPSSGLIFISKETEVIDTELKFELFNTFGQAVQSGQSSFDGNLAKIDFSTVKDGVYLLNIKTDEQTITRKITLKK